MLNNQYCREILGFYVYMILFISCTCVGFWQVPVGTCKFIFHPHEVRTFLQEIHLPQLILGDAEL